MATIIWCDRVRHIVQESRTQVEDMIATGQTAEAVAPKESENCWTAGMAGGFVYFTPEGSTTQRALNVAMISSFEALPGDGI